MKKVPPFMQGLIATVLLGDFSYMLIARPSEALTQTLLTLVVVAVSFYLGYSSAQGTPHPPPEPGTTTVSMESTTAPKDPT